MPETNWVTLEVKDSQTKNHTIGPVTIWLKKVSNEIWVAYHHTETGDDKSVNQVEVLNWSRWALPDDETQFSFKPIFPNRSVVVKPEYPFSIVKGAKVRVYTRIPVFIRVGLADKPSFVITEIPSVPLLGTWFGTFTEGEMCYWVSTTARRAIDPDIMREWMAVCPIELTNKHQEPLDFDKFCLRVEHLNIYKTDNSLWADETLIIHQGREKYSDIEMKNKLPPEAKGGILLMKPRTPIKKNLAVRSFKLLKDISTWD
ncbi:MAG: DUF432 domain-containing protein [Balneolales bacterium]